MAMVSFKCPRCAKKFSAAPSAYGGVVCPHCGAKLRAPGTDKESPGALVGQTLGQYVLRELIKSSATGAVYKARHGSLPRECAIKVLPQKAANDPAFVERFRREARAVAAINHTAIAQVFEVGDDKGYGFIVMEHVDGESLGDRLKRTGPLPPDAALDLLKQTASALAAAHALGIVHRNIKPANLMVTPSGAVKVMDFGLAKRSGEDVDVTAQGALIGTPLYMAPEVAEGHGADARSDLYSLGATFYCALAGRSPVDAPTTAAIITKLLHEEPLPLPPSVPNPLRGAIHRLLAKDPAKRFQSAQELAAALAAPAAPPPQPRAERAPMPPPLPPAPAGPARESKQARPDRAKVIVLAIIVGIFLVGGIIALVLLLRR
ncbi:MAG: serine/threonine protein kinase [Planctomycetes bacterium]|nr:serine/threonine protein kinase [Planctomycetota bacterium]